MRGTSYFTSVHSVGLLTEYPKQIFSPRSLLSQVRPVCRVHWQHNQNSMKPLQLHLSRGFLTPSYLKGASCVFSRRFSKMCSTLEYLTYKRKWKIHGRTFGPNPDGIDRGYPTTESLRSQHHVFVVNGACGHTLNANPVVKEFMEQCELEVHWVGQRCQSI